MIVEAAFLATGIVAGLLAPVFFVEGMRRVGLWLGLVGAALIGLGVAI